MTTTVFNRFLAGEVVKEILGEPETQNPPGWFIADQGLVSGVTADAVGEFVGALKHLSGSGVVVSYGEDTPVADSALAADFSQIAEEEKRLAARKMGDQSIAQTLIYYLNANNVAKALSSTYPDGFPSNW